MEKLVSGANVLRPVKTQPGHFAIPRPGQGGAPSSGSASLEGAIACVNDGGVVRYGTVTEDDRG
eukprot:2341379-Pyramimonas_sp.AAC.1